MKKLLVSKLSGNIFPRGLQNKDHRRSVFLLRSPYFVETIKYDGYMMDMTHTIAVFTLLPLGVAGEAAAGLLQILPSMAVHPPARGLGFTAMGSRRAGIIVSA